MLSLDKLTFFSKHPIDKVVQEGEVTVVNDGDTTPTDDYQKAKIVTKTGTNNYGRACLARVRWSIDNGTNWQGLENRIVYLFVYEDTANGFTQNLKGLDSAMSIGCSDNLIYFRTANGKHGKVTDDGSNINYTPETRTFLIQYALYERE